MRTDDFSYFLPQALIAQTPQERRDQSRLLIIDRPSRTIKHHAEFTELTNYLQRGDVLVFNNSRVNAVRIRGHFVETGGKIELLFLERLGGGLWRCLSKPARKLKIGSQLTLDGNGAQITASITDIEPEGFRVVQVNNESALSQVGEIPLPPYIHKQLIDKDRYQTVYAKIPGSAAAPTAGLHFTDGLLERLKVSGIELVFTTLHIGPGTFRPVLVEDPEHHQMHREHFAIGVEACERINTAKREGRRIICVGTTSLRLLETIAAWGDKRDEDDQDKECKTQFQSEKVLSNITGIQPISSSTDLFILPGYKFKIADGLITNFHLPKSTLLMLVCAFAGQKLILDAYKEAIRLKYRFFSFGDAMLIQ